MNGWTKRVYVPLNVKSYSQFQGEGMAAHALFLQITGVMLCLAGSPLNMLQVETQEVTPLSCRMSWISSESTQPLPPDKRSTCQHLLLLFFFPPRCRIIRIAALLHKIGDTWRGRIDEKGEGGGLLALPVGHWTCLRS